MDTRTRHRAAGRRAGPAGLPARAVIAVATGLLVLVATASPTLAHAALVSSDPADGAVLATPPAAITLTFDEALAPRSSLRLLGPDGATIGTAAPAAGSDSMVLGGLALGSGAYTIEWTSVAADGDVERGRLTFTVASPTSAPATPTPASSAAASPLSTPEPPQVSPSPAASPAPAPAPAAEVGDVIVPIVAALALVAVVGALVLRRTRAG